MFHLMIGLWAMGFLVAAIAVATIPLWLGFLVQFFIGLLSTGKLARWVPAVLGVIGFAASLYSLWFGIGFPLLYLVIYWGIYALLLWAAHSLGRKFQKWWLARKEKH